MKSVRISADLERRLRAVPDSLEGLKGLVGEVVQLMNEGPRPNTHPVGLGYKDLVVLFRNNLGPALALPPAPSAGWIIRQVNKAKEIGLDGESIGRLCTLARAKYPRGTLELEFLLRIATRVLAEDGQDAGPPTPTTVTTGRGVQDA